MINKKRYQLEKYKGGQTKRICPECGRKSFTLFIDTYTGLPIADDCGRCDHSRSCSLGSATLKDYYRQHKQTFDDIESRIKTPVIKPEPPTPPEELDAYRSKWLACMADRLRYSTKSDDVLRSTFVSVLNSIFDKEDVSRVINEYQIGATTWHDVTRTYFWLIDKDGCPLDAKTIVYDERLHRVKNNEEGKRLNINWAHNYIREIKTSIPHDFDLPSCLFGAHLLAKYPDKVVGLVEAEKTAVVASVVFPDLVWVATGGKQQKPVEKCKDLRGRRVVMFPDADAIGTWELYANEIRRVCGVQSLVINKYIDDNANTLPKGADIADVILSPLIENY